MLFHLLLDQFLYLNQSLINGLGRTPHIMDDHANVPFDLLFTFLGLLKLNQQLIVLKLKIFGRHRVLED
jgi:hypothetical protein